MWVYYFHWYKAYKISVTVADALSVTSLCTILFVPTYEDFAAKYNHFQFYFFGEVVACTQALEIWDLHV